MDMSLVIRQLNQLAREDNFIWLYEPKKNKFIFDTGTKFRKISEMHKEYIEWLIEVYGPKGVIITYVEE